MLLNQSYRQLLAYMHTLYAYMYKIVYTYVCMSECMHERQLG